MLKNKNKLFIIALFNASLVMMPFQASIASMGKSSHESNMKNQHVTLCVHAKSAIHSPNEKSKLVISSRRQHVDSMAGMIKILAEDDLTQHKCQCTESCANCNVGHSTVVLLDFENRQFIKPWSSQPESKGDDYKTISLTVENPPPVS